MVNGEPFLRVIEGPSPSGVELRHAQGFLQIEAQIEPAARKNRIDSNGDLNLAAAVDWSKVVSDAEKLAATGRDLKLLVIVARAWTNLEGFAGLAAGFELISDSLLAHWDSIHPELRDRPDKAMAAKGRESAIRDMENREDGILGDLEMRVILDPRGIGPIRGSELAQAALSNYEYMQIGTGGMSAKEKEAWSAKHTSLQNRVHAAIMATQEEAPDKLGKLKEAIDAADRARASLEAAYAKAGGFENGGGFRLSDIQVFLSRCAKALDSVADAAPEATAETGEEPMRPDTDPGPAATAAPPAAKAEGGVPGRIESRSDVEKCLDMIIEFYERTEPASPIPHLASRMRRMVPMDFMQLMEEVAPSGLKDFKNIAGVDDKKSKD